MGFKPKNQVGLEQKKFERRARFNPENTYFQLMFYFLLLTFCENTNISYRI